MLIIRMWFNRYEPYGYVDEYDPHDGDGDEEELSGANRETYQFQSVDQSAERTKRNATEVKVKTEEPHTSQSVRSRKVPFRNEMINAS